MPANLENSAVATEKGEYDADDTTLMAESEEELKSLFMKVKEESEKGTLKLNIRKMKAMANTWGNNGNTDRLCFLGLQSHFRW